MSGEAVLIFSMGRWGLLVMLQPLKSSNQPTSHARIKEIKNVRATIASILVSRALRLQMTDHQQCEPRVDDPTAATYGPNAENAANSRTQTRRTRAVRTRTWDAQGRRRTP